ncbi:MAG TPA: CAP domain-containing protein [Polyangia bacterium]
MRTRVVVMAVGVALGGGACTVTGEDAVVAEGKSAALGQPNGDYPSYDERVVLYATNRARVDPAAEGWAAYPAQPPLQWHFDLNRAARAHSQDMRDTPCFQHKSCNGTSMSARLRSFYTGPAMAMGENISTGRSVNDGFIVVHNWIFEVGAPAGETGHRDNIFSAKYTLMGAGFAPGGTQYQNYWTQDFVGTPVTRPRMSDGIHFPAAPAAGTAVSFGTTYEDANPPSQLAVVVAGACTPLSRVRGTAVRGAYEARVTLPAGCHPYHFVAIAGGTTTTYPDPGVFQVAVGVAAASCPLASTNRPAVACAGDAGVGAPIPPPPSDAGAVDAGSGGGTGGRTGGARGGASGNPGGSGGAGGRDAGMSPSTGQGGSGGTATGGNAATGSAGGQPGSAGNPGATPVDESGGCSLAQIRRANRSASLLPLAWLIAGVVGARSLRRRPRRRPDR